MSCDSVTQSSMRTAIKGPTPTSPRGSCLCRVYPTDDSPKEGGPYTDFDIIAIHGLDTNSPDTWIWRSPYNPETGSGTEVNWLADLLPAVTGGARIFTCDWPADLIQQSSVPTTLRGCAQSLHDSILEHLEKNPRRPVFFIASCLGGIVLMKALEIDSQRPKDNADSPSLTKTTRGIIFLATPFRGTAFRKWPEFLLKALSYLQDQTVTALVGYALTATSDLDDLTRGFITIAAKNKYEVVMFCETRNTVLLRKFHLAWVVSRWTLKAWLLALASVWLLGFFSPWLLVFFLLWLPLFWYYQPQLLVDEHSATLSDYPPHRLDRTHVMMNKFSHKICPNECKKECTESRDFRTVSKKIIDTLQTIHKSSLSREADTYIRDIHYSADKLLVQRLSGKFLPLESCYINLAIIRFPSSSFQHTERRPEETISPRTSPFQLTTRPMIETPDKDLQVQLPSLFDQCEDSDGKILKPTRILIRGRAGIGKTTLCKKIVHEFAHGSEDFREWRGKFDRVLWVPLRNLKDWLPKRFALESLFVDHFFVDRDIATRKSLAKELQCAVDENEERTLFVLDGLDEITYELGRDDCRSKFITSLLNKRSVIITSRLQASHPKVIHNFHLELETIGFFPDQVQAYLQAVVKDQKKVDNILLYLQAHEQMQGLVRIPIILDVLCYVWDNLKDKILPDTMTAIYKATQEVLFKKDILRLRKSYNHERVIPSQIEELDMDGVKSLVQDEIDFLEGLAFTGLLNDFISFGQDHRKTVLNKFISPDKWISCGNNALCCLSFLRTSDPPSDDGNRTYDFLHLTFQEYFAAQYFVRQLKTKGVLKCLRLRSGAYNEIEPAAFLYEHKYDPRYDIFWRFVAGLLRGEQALDFFQKIEEKPHDLLGPTHQRLVMHCLSESVGEEKVRMTLRPMLEDKLRQWLLFECKLTKNCWLAREVECPEQVLVDALNQASQDERLILLNCLNKRATVPSGVVDIIVPWLKDCKSKELRIAISKILRHHHKALPEEILELTVKQISSKDRDARQASFEVLQSQASLPEWLLQRIVTMLWFPKDSITRAGVEVLPRHYNFADSWIPDPTEDWVPDLMDEYMPHIPVPLTGEDIRNRLEAVKVFQNQNNLTDEFMERLITVNIKHIYSMLSGEEVIGVLQGRANFTDKLLNRIVSLLDDGKDELRIAVLRVLQGQANLPYHLLESIESILEGRCNNVSWAAVKVLQSQNNLTNTSLLRVLALLEHEDSDFRKAAINILQDNVNTIGKPLERIAAELKKRDGIQLAVLEALQGRVNPTDDLLSHTVVLEALQGRNDLTDELLQRIAGLLGHGDRSVRLAAVEVLQSQNNLTDELMERMAVLLEDGDDIVRLAVLNVLQGQTNFTYELLQRIVALIEHGDPEVQLAVLNVLQGRTNLTGESLQCIAKLLGSVKWYIIRAAVKVLQGQANLTDELLERIAELLKDQNHHVRCTVVKALQDQKNLADKLLQRVTVLLEDKDRDVRLAAVKALQSQAYLTDELLRSVAARLKNKHWYIRLAAVTALQGRVDLPDDLIEHIAEHLKDEDTRQAALEVLLGQKKLSLDVLGTSVVPLYHALLERSFGEHLYCSSIGGGFIGFGLSSITLECRLENEYDVKIQEEHSRLGVPPIDITSIGSGSVSGVSNGHWYGPLLRYRRRARR